MALDYLPSWLIFASFGLSILVGLSLIIISQVRNSSDNGPLMELELLGNRLSATKMMMQAAFGIILLVTPVIFVYALESRNAPGAQVTPQAKEVANVADIPDPSYEGFVFKRDVSIIDLRASRDVPDHQKKELYSPVTLMNHMTLRKTRPEKSISFTYATSGVLVNPRCLTHPYVLKKTMKPDVHGDHTLKEVWELEINLEEVPIDQEFFLAVEATYWNAFEAPKQRNFSTYANDQSEPEELSITLLFPEKRPFKSYNLLAYPHDAEDSNKAQPFQGTPRITKAKDNLSIYWMIPKAQTGYAYEIRWDY